MGQGCDFLVVVIFKSTYISLNLESGLLYPQNHLPHLLWEAELEQVGWVAPVGVVGHREDLQEDHRGVEEMTLEMTFPGDRPFAIETQFQQPDLSLWAHCALRPQHDMLGESSQGYARG